MGNRHGIVLFGHGARDARWAEPFERLALQLCAMRGDEQPVMLAFLELMEPGLFSAVASLAALGCDEVTVVPVFFGQGGHVRKDLPAVVEQCRAAFPHLAIRCMKAVGEDDAVLQAIAHYCLRQV